MPVTLADAALTVALGQLGVTEHPPASNRGPEVDAYLRRVGIDPSEGGEPWCAAFVSWCVSEAILRVGGPPQWRGSASARGLLLGNPSLHLEAPVPGCVFVHVDPDGTHGHCGFVLAVEADDTLATLEGNTDRSGSRTGGQVMRQRRPRDYATGFVRIA